MLSGWTNFYLILGPASATLIGLMFVVVSLTSGLERSRALRAGAAYMTPTILHFGAVLVVSATAVAPPMPAGLLGLVVGAVAVAGAVGAVRACVQLRAFVVGPGSNPHWSDHLTYGVLPLVLYLALAGVALGLACGARLAVNALALTTLALLIMGVRNAWDLISWMAPKADPEDPAPPGT